MSRVVLSSRARKDLDDIWLYIARDNPAAADGFIDVPLRQSDGVNQVEPERKLGGNGG